MKRTGAVVVLVACALAAGCGDDNTTAPSGLPLVYTAQLSPANEVPPISNSESTARGAMQVSFNVTRNASNAITAATATFYYQVLGLGGTRLQGAHIHNAPAGVNGTIVVDTGLSPTNPFTLSENAVENTATVSVDPLIMQAIIDNPQGFYFNVHTPANPGGVARGQLVRIQ